jgi:DNA-directed RNA polymerase subunit L
MPVFIIENETHTLASALRPVLEELNPEEMTSCTLNHPMDNHVTVDAPSETALRTALLKVKDLVRESRRMVETSSTLQ